MSRPSFTLARWTALPVLLAVLVTSTAARNGPSFGGGGGGDPAPGPPPPFVQQPPPQIPGGVLAPVRGSPVLLAIAGGGGARREVRLRTPDGRVLARALTDARGVAVLRAPEGVPLLLDVPGVVPPFPVTAGQVVRIVLAADHSDGVRRQRDVEQIATPERRQP